MYLQPFSYDDMKHNNESTTPWFIFSNETLDSTGKADHRTLNPDTISFWKQISWSREQTLHPLSPESTLLRARLSIQPEKRKEMMRKIQLYESTHTLYSTPSKLNMTLDEKVKVAAEIEDNRARAEAKYPGCTAFWPAFIPDIWNDEDATRVNNCLAYCFLDYAESTTRTGKPQPGDRSGLSRVTNANYSCNAFQSRLVQDYPGVTFHKTFIIPRYGYYLGALVLATSGEAKDYHFLVLMRNGQWSHKPGMSPVSLLDADGKFIADPKKADLNYPNWKYKTFCCYIEIPSIQFSQFNTNKSIVKKCENQSCYDTSLDTALIE